MPSLGDYLIIGVVAAVVTFAVTPAVGWYARRRGWVYIPNERSVHTSPVPDVGGLAMLIGFFAALGCGADARPVRRVVPHQHRAAGRRHRRHHHLPRRVHRRHPRHSAARQGDGHRPRRRGAGLVRRDDVLRPGAVLRRDRPVPGLEAVGHRAVAAGDDAGDQSHRRPRRARRRHRRHRRRRSSSSTATDSPSSTCCRRRTSVPCSRSSPSGCASASSRTTSTRRGSSWATAGPSSSACCWPCPTSVVGGRADENTQAFVGQTFFFLAPLVIPLLILGVPILDTVFAIVRRTTCRQAIDVADKGHLHHRLMNLGHGHRRSVLILVDMDGAALGVRALPGAHQREPDLPAVRDRRPGDRAVHRLPPERPPPHQRRPLTPTAPHHHDP